MISSSNVLYGASSADRGSVCLLKATTSRTPVKILEEDTGKTIVYRAEPGGDEVPDPHVHKVQPLNLRGDDGNLSHRNSPHTSELPTPILQAHFAGERYLGCSAYDDALRTHWFQYDCDHSLEEYLRDKGATTEAFQHMIRTVLDTVSEHLKFGLFRTRNNYALNFYFRHAITRRHQQALYMLIFSKLHVGGSMEARDKAKYPVECLPDNPFILKDNLDPSQGIKHPSGRTPILRGFAIRDTAASHGVGCLVGGPVDLLLQSGTWTREERRDAADEEDDLCDRLWIEEDVGAALEKLAAGYEARGFKYDDSMPAFYKAMFNGPPAGTAVTTTSSGNVVKKDKHRDAEEKDPEELDEMIHGIAARKGINVPPHLLTALYRMSPCILLKMWEPEVGRTGNQNSYGRHILTEVQRAERAGLVKEADMAELHTLICHLSMEDGDSPGETERNGIKPYLRRLHDKTEPRNPSCSECRMAGICNKDLCSTVEGGFLRESGNQALSASGVMPICKTFCRPVQLIVQVDDQLTAIPFPVALKLAPIRTIIESGGTVVPRLPKEKAYAAAVSALPQLTLDDIASHEAVAGRRITGLYSLDSRLLIYMRNHWVEPLLSSRRTEGKLEERPPMTQLGLGAIALNDETLFFGWEDLVNAAAAVIGQASSAYGAPEISPSLIAGFFDRPDTKAVTFRQRVPPPLPYGVHWCSIELEEFHQLCERNANKAPQ